jgi:hypothetical protein
MGQHEQPRYRASERTGADIANAGRRGALPVVSNVKGMTGKPTNAGTRITVEPILEG